MSAQGAMSFCRINGILNKDYKKWMMNRQNHLSIESLETPVKKFTKNIGIEFYHSDL
jgi:hypothetical protein